MFLTSWPAAFRLKKMNIPERTRRHSSKIGFGALLLAAAVPLAAQDMVKVEASISPLRLARGQEGKVVLKVSLKKGIAVSALPAFTIEIDGGENLVFAKTFFTGSDLALARIEVDGRDCLDLKAPIEITFKVGPKARRGVYILRGRIKYFAFDLAEGVCLKSSAKFSTSYSTWAVSARRE